MRRQPSSRSGTDNHARRPKPRVPAAKPPEKAEMDAVPLQMATSQPFSALDAPTAIERMNIGALQRAVGNSAVSHRVLRRRDSGTTELAGPSSHSVQRGPVIQRDPPPTTDPSQETPPKPADLPGTSKMPC